MNISNKKKEPPNINGLTSASLRLRKLCAVANNNTFATIDLFPLWAVSFLYMGDNGSPHPTITCSSSESLTRTPCIAIDSQKLIRLLARFLCVSNSPSCPSSLCLQVISAVFIMILYIGLLPILFWNCTFILKSSVHLIQIW